MAFEFFKRKSAATEPNSAVPSSAEPELLLEPVQLPRRSVQKAIRSLFAAGKINIEDLEDTLIKADFGVAAAEQLALELKKQARSSGAETDKELRSLLVNLLTTRLTRPDTSLKIDGKQTPQVFLVIGVNGAGKTTTIGKLAGWLVEGGFKVTLGAADTFRAAATEQLQTWASRSGAEVVLPEQPGQDPAAVAYRTVDSAIQSGADVAIIDTAGRLQNKKDLMDELGKIRRAVEKLSPISEVLLVIDSTTGQNALSQARAFSEVANVTGVIATKLDGSAKGGVLYSIQSELNIPIKLVGVGESMQDFAFFDAAEFARGLVG